MSLSRRGFAALALALSGSHAFAAGGDVMGVRFGGDRQRTRLVVDVVGSAEGCGLAVDPGLAALSVTVTGVNAQPAAGPGRGLVSHWNLTQTMAGARLVVTLTGPARVERTFQIPPGEQNGVWRFVLDLVIHTPPRIVIDPGHGGDDVGARGGFSYEKDVTLAAALALRYSLVVGQRYDVSLTRADDRFIPLSERRDAARGADLFVSLHADASASPEVRGASAYSVSDDGVQRALSRNPIRWTAADVATAGVLADLNQRGVRNRSAAFAEHLLTVIGQQEAPLLKRSHREAGFVVLMGLSAPAVLLEMGFMTNHDDESRLNDPARRSRLATLIKQAIDAHLGFDVVSPTLVRG